MGNIKVRYLVAKKKKNHILYYWQPTKDLQEYGFLPMRLARKTNNLADAVKEAEKYNGELDAWRKGNQQEPGAKEGTVSWLIDMYEKSIWFCRLEHKTKVSYAHHLKHIRVFAGNYSINSMTRVVCKTYYNSLAEKSLHNANAALRQLRVLFSFAIDEGIISENPAKGIRLVGTKARTEVWEDKEIAQMVSKAISLGRNSIAIAIKLAEGLGQREGDILHLSWESYDGECIQAVQNKTKTPIRVKCSEELRSLLDAVRKDAGYIVVSEKTGNPYKQDNFQSLFADIRNACGITGKWFMDLRRTAVVRLAEAGCTIPEIAAISGHSIETCQKILEVYLPRNAEMAANAVDKLEAYRRGKLEIAVGT